jgi:murein L,D-transpeptidase YcbB/YkuD
MGADAEIDSFYAGRRLPLWLERAGPKPAAEALVALLARADEDGLDPARYDLDRLRAALRDRRRTNGATLRDDKLFSAAFARWVSDLHQPSDAVSVHYTDAVLEPERRSAGEILAAAAAAPSLDAHLVEVRRMNPLYEAVRRAMAARPTGSARETLRANLARLRALPRDPGPRFVLVDSASARLWMYERGKPVGSMKVVVGRPGMSTPLMAGLIRYVALRPYWNLPPDLVRDTYAPRFVAGGWRTVVKQRFEVLSDFSDQPRTLNPRDVDWSAVAEGREQVRVRQLPGGANFMGAMKFMFPNPLGIYLHDTPERWAFGKSDRRISSGCVRLEDARRLLAWAFAGKPPVLPKANREKAVDLPVPVPVYITYLTALPDPAGRITYQADVDGRDATLLAALDPPPPVTSAGRPRRGGSASGSDR